jgi:hypothetical protein
MVKKIYTDKENELQVYVNDDNKCFIEISQPSEEMFGTGYIVLEAEDVKELITDLENILKQIEK